MYQFPQGKRAALMSICNLKWQVIIWYSEEDGEGLHYIPTLQGSPNRYGLTTQGYMSLALSLPDTLTIGILSFLYPLWNSYLLTHFHSNYTLVQT